MIGRQNRPAMLAAHLRRMQWLEGRLRKPLRYEFLRLYTVVARALQTDGIVAADAAQFGHLYAVETLLRHHLARAAQTIGGRLLTELQRLVGQKASFEDLSFNKRIREWLQGPALSKVAQGISKRTREQIRKIIQRGVSRGQGVEAIARNIRRLAPTISAYRAHTIARTEVHNASEWASDQAARSVGIPEMKREWVAVADNRTRDEHRLADGQVRGMDEYFEFKDANGVFMYRLLYPGDETGPPGGVINCRCSLAFIPPED